ncbi:MAG: putative 2-aminoethylphosphonate ABC transporter substrate-binding protein [Coriobacteriales bacterium]|nr:putative 2-aminoethylphosphonate ABC transporter substrate-binding protein [Coriobacteriales bacterium]
MKKVISFILVVLTMAVIVASFASCTNTGAGTNTGSTTDNSTGSYSNSQHTNSQTSANTDSEAQSITVYTALEDELVTKYLEDFKAKYPNITVNVVRESTGIITAKLIAEKDNPQADVIWGTAASSMMVLDDQDQLEPYAPQGVNKILAKFKSEKSIPTWVGMDVWETAFVINTVELSKLGLSVQDIKDYDDLLNPALKGHIVMSNPSSSGTGLLTVSGLLQLNDKSTNNGWDTLDKLHQNVAQYVHSGSKPAKMAASGETVIGVSFGYAGISQAEKGAPVVTVFPKSGSGWDIEANALVKKATINPAAKTFLDWAISDSAMNLYKEEYPLICNGQGGKYSGFTKDPVDQLISNDFSWVAANRDQILKEWTARYDSKSAAK